MNRTSGARAVAGTMSTTSVRSKRGSSILASPEFQVDSVVGRTKIEMILDVLLVGVPIPLDLSYCWILSLTNSTNM